MTKMYKRFYFMYFLYAFQNKYQKSLIIFYSRKSFDVLEVTMVLRKPLSHTKKKFISMFVNKKITHESFMDVS